MSKRNSRKRVDNAKPTYNVPGPVREYIEAISDQCDRILASAKAKSLDDRCRQWNAAVNDPQCKRDIEQLFGRAMATLQLLPAESRKHWIQRLGKLAHENKELMRRAENFGVLKQRFLESGRPLLTFLLTGRQANPTPDVETALGEFETSEEQHRKLVNAARVELAVLEEAFRIKWDKRETLASKETVSGCSILVERLNGFGSAGLLRITEHVQGDAVVDMRLSTNGIDRLLHLAVATIAAFDRIGGRWK